ncbi:peptidoglycan/LPS O-acetylase OafA/YrhL [Pontibacter ummariensis]|uniref:Peptidoglycan/LPS O-acetylase OafA/YrhL, contains acyltransferase and SGNH-hydrolase domains n=1 Tax=Pontibacter ummariensis TaxID=1610492 RepID=A0A239BLS0_9BACT|nr:acyltransferase [Pontibacter ummariensis]PRY15740.1 peptidoglycan/LPS O-acetylase OafA/YrhL [Pontibacter ummariensis]SNS09127.1 Peptidoglycan/LPS O-acetylase OafA/YrhL, contains acyltransferase and SGNH-hydrolase domains [Pontibacter ummariensis]
MSLNKPNYKYKPQLDGLRTLAVAMVIMSHWAPNMSIFGRGAHIGVQLFFVLSGYLITAILIDARAKAESIGSGMGMTIKSFYARRFLRIFPLYYLVLLLMLAIGAPNILEHLPWHAIFFTNIKIAENGWIGEASHLWSLAVEEQFYLIWPLVILLTPRRFLLITVISFVLASPLFKVLYGIYEGEMMVKVLPISSFHSLGTGALLTFIDRSNFRNMQRTIAMASITGLITLLALFFSASSNLWFGIVDDFALTLCLVGLVYAASKGFKGTIGNVLASPLMLYLGKISYGLYLLHNFVPFINTTWLNIIGAPPMETLGPYVFFALNSLVLLLLSSLSWHFFESKFNVYKKHFPYTQNKVLVPT